MSNLCIIPARGGSKRIPRKNIKLFLDKPIIAYSIKAAIESNLFDEIMVSTEDEEIAKMSIKFGAKVPFFRSKKNSDDFATTYDVIEEVIINYKNEGIEFHNVCCIYACAPFVTPTILVSTLKLLKEKAFDTVFPIIAYGFPIQRALKKQGDKVSMIIEKNLTVRSQDLEDTFHDAGQFYWCKTKKILKSKTLLTSNTGGVVISELEAQDIDNEIDWKMAELKFKLR